MSRGKNHLGNIFGTIFHLQLHDYTIYKFYIEILDIRLLNIYAAEDGINGRANISAPICYHSFDISSYNSKKLNRV